MQISRQLVARLLVGGTLVVALSCGQDASDEDAKGGAHSAGSGGSAGTTNDGGKSGGSAGAPRGGASGSGNGAGRGGSSEGGSNGTTAGEGGAEESGTGGMAGTPTGGAGASDGGAPEWGVETRPTGQTCSVHTSSQQAKLLSDSGCVDPKDPKRPAATLIAYDVATPLWSDGATKYRYFALPDTGKIHVKDCTTDAPDCKDPLNDGGTYEEEGDWDFPDGTVFVKTFAFEGKLVETRLLMKRDRDNWWGFSYQWRDDQSDADLLGTDSDGYDALVEGPDGPLNWHFPSRAQCLQCHTTAAGVSLGLETSQLNFDFTYPNGAQGNQLETLEHAGLFEAKPPPRPAYVTPSDTAADLDERARSYLHANCSICHRPGANFTDFDARYSTAFKDTNLCGATPDKAVPAELMLSDPKRLDPGHPENSVVSLRMHSLETTFRMPQIGSRVVDDTGTTVVDDWIASLTGCPQ